MRIHILLLTALFPTLFAGFAHAQKLEVRTTDKGAKIWRITLPLEEGTSMEFIKASPSAYFLRLKMANPPGVVKEGMDLIVITAFPYDLVGKSNTKDAMQSDGSLIVMYPFDAADMIKMRDHLVLGFKLETEDKLITMGITVPQATQIIDVLTRLIQAK